MDCLYKMLYPIGDMHMDYYDLFMKDYFEKTLDSIYKEPDSYILGMGDYLEISTMKSVEPYSNIGTNTRMYIRLRDYFKKFADEERLIGLLSGNHEDRIKKIAKFDLVEVLSNDLGVPYFGRAKLFYDDRLRYTIYATHPDTAPTTRGGRDLMFRKTFAIQTADLYLFGHLHTLDSDDNSIRFNKYGYTQKNFACTGHFLKYLGSYAERKLYSAQIAGCQEIKLYQNKHKIEISRYEPNEKDM